MKTINQLTFLYNRQRFIKQLDKVANEKIEKDDDGNILLHSSVTTIYNHQVAGHTNEILRSFNGYILKPRLKPDLFTREVSIYESLASNQLAANNKTGDVVTTNDSSELSPTTSSAVTELFFPKYYGVVNLRVHNYVKSVISYLCLEDLTLNYQLPCAIDIKMGEQTYEPTATSRKKRREVKKYIYQDSIGFRITGFKSYDTTRNAYVSRDKYFGRSLHPSQIKYGLAAFFFDGVEVKVDVLEDTILQLQQLLQWIKIQTDYHFYCSSILIIYEANQGGNQLQIIKDCNNDNNDISRSYTNVTNSSSNSTSQNNGEENRQESTVINSSSTSNLTASTSTTSDTKLKIRMIDLAHTIHNKSGLIDFGYFHGVQSLINYLKLILVAARENKELLSQGIRDVLLNTPSSKNKS